MSTRQGVTLQPSLQSMFRQHLYNSTAVVGRLWVPLEVSVSDLEAFVELVRVELVGREDAERLGVEFDDFGDVRADPGEGQIWCLGCKGETYAFMFEICWSTSLPKSFQLGVLSGMNPR